MRCATRHEPAATRCIRCSTVRARTRPSVKCATRFVRCGGNTKRCPLYSFQWPVSSFQLSKLKPSKGTVGRYWQLGTGNYSYMRKIRVVIAKPGLDGHDRGAKVIARALRDAGMEVIYTGLRQTPEQIVAAALQEDADAIGLSILSGAHMHICPRVMELLREKGLDDVLVVIGGIIPDVDIPKLNEIGIKGVFLPGTPMQDIITFITENVRPRVEQV